VEEYQAASGWRYFTYGECITLGIDNVNATNITIYPNPAKNELSIQSDSPINKVEIYNLAGKCVLRESNFAGSVNVSGLAAGVYLVKANDKIAKLIISK
ncbi:MAG: T9SS type A sorting domain-containing protein, partial [Prevotellaceae bacterium]|nr:T9SS type A sorting domain-containing protein [Prevotellaceae bacterium]